MPNCKQCGTRLSNLDKDICPVCGAKNPLEDAISHDTIDFTQTLDAMDTNEPLYRQKSKSMTCLLSCLLGIFGAQFFYIGKTKLAIVWLIINIAILAGIGTLCAVLLQMYWLYGVFAGALYLVNIGIGLYYRFKNDTKDGKGEYLK